MMTTIRNNAMSCGRLYEPWEPVAAAASIDPILRDTASFAVLSDVPGAVTLSYFRGGSGADRVGSDGAGVLGRTLVPDAHCVACAIRDDVSEALRRLVDLDRWEAIALMLPVAVEPMPVVRVWSVTTCLPSAAWP